MDLLKPLCIICMKTEEEEPGLKKYTSRSSLLKAAERRHSLVSDKYSSATNNINSAEDSTELFYHSKCHSRYCAVGLKRKVSNDGAESTTSPSASKTVRLQSDLPSTSKSGIPIKSCIFCANERRRSSGGFDSIHKVQHKECSVAIIQAAKSHPTSQQSQRVLSLGSEDLVAIEAHYHNICKLQFLQQARQAAQKQNESKAKDISIKNKHEKTFQEFSTYIEQEIISKRTPWYVSSLLKLYKDHYLANWGEADDIDIYTSQNIVRKLKSKFRDRIVISKESKKKGNFIYPEGMSQTDALLKLKNLNLHEDEIRRAALLLRSEILKMSSTKLPSPTSVQSLKETASEIPPLTSLFYQTLVSGLSTTSCEATERKSLSMASDAVYSTSRGNVRPWKHTTLGLGLSSMLGSKATLTILNHLGHTVSYDECKRMETEIAYSCSARNQETPHGLVLDGSLATGTAWDNFDLNIETVNGKDTFHATVGIAYQNASFDGKSTNTNGNSRQVNNQMIQNPRRTYEGSDKPVTQYISNLKKAIFHFEESEQDKSEITEIDHSLILAQSLDTLWLILSRVKHVPLFNGFFSRFVDDPLPVSIITYMDPISHSPTRNDVVHETMLRSLRVAEEANMPFHPVTYDLAVAVKAYSIQSLESPIFDKLVILLGPFHIELAFFGGLGTYIADSGLEYILTESNILAEGSLNGFLHGKHYNRCSRVHQVTAMALEQSLFERFLESECSSDHADLLDTIHTLPSEKESQKDVALSDEFKKLSEDYEKFFHRVIKGDFGETATYWAVYIYFINRLFREFQRAVRTNNVELYIKVFPSMIDVFFALNRPNYARWGSYSLEKMASLNKEALDILKAGAFSIRRTTKEFSRSPIDLTLEQTVNRDASSTATGITHFSNSVNAFRRWSCNLSQRGMAVSEMKELSGVHRDETPAKQLRENRIKQDNRDVVLLKKLLQETCNPFAAESPNILVNIATGKMATNSARKYLLGTLQRGAQMRCQFHRECVEDNKRFLKRVHKVPVENFASTNAKKKEPKVKKDLQAAESVRDAFACLLSKSNIDLHLLLSFPIINVPLCIAHADGSPTKTEKASLTKLLEKKYTSPDDQDKAKMVDATLFDGGLVLHEILAVHNTSTYGKIVQDIFVTICQAKGKSVHLLMDRYKTPSIKDVERMNRGAEFNEGRGFVITGPEQKQQKKGRELLRNSEFKEALAQFVLEEAQKEYIAPLIGQKEVFVSHGGKCLKLHVNSIGKLVIEEPPEFQGEHEEADTLLAFHAFQIGGNIEVRSSDSDVLVIFLGLSKKMPPLSNICMDFGAGNNRRIIRVSDMARQMEKQRSGLSEALIGFHAVTGCDFNSAFYGKGKSSPFSYVEKCDAHVKALKSLSMADIDFSSITAFVCRIYGFKNITNINEARYETFIKMVQGNAEKYKKINCASLPPCQKTLHQHVARAHYISLIWSRAHTPMPAEGLHPLDYGWKEGSGGQYIPNWYDGAPLPDSMSEEQESGLDDVMEDNHSDAETEIYDVDEDQDMVEHNLWSSDSDTDYED